MGTSIEGPFQLTPPSYSREIILGQGAEPTQTIYETSSAQKYALGTKLVYPDGRVFRYALSNSSTALSKSYMTQAAANTANIITQTQTTSGANVEIGDYEIVVDVTNASGITDDQLAQGWLVVASSTGAGDIYKILSCKLLTTATARLLLENPIRTAWSATTVISLIRNKWYGVVVLPTTATQVAAGVPLVDVAVSTYFWAQTAGPAPVYVDNGDTVVIGNNVGTPGTAAAAGKCGVQTAGTFQIWGQVMYVAAGDAVAIIDLHLED